jgi:hypothetical protein
LRENRAKQKITGMQKRKQGGKPKGWNDRKGQNERAKKRGGATREQTARQDKRREADLVHEPV